MRQHLDAARELFEEVIEGKTAQLGGSHASTLTTKCCLASLQQRIGEMDVARKLYVLRAPPSSSGDASCRTKGARLAPFPWAPWSRIIAWVGLGGFVGCNLQSHQGPPRQ